jgi:hypothetical protein
MEGAHAAWLTLVTMVDWHLFSGTFVLSFTGLASLVAVWVALSPRRRLWRAVALFALPATLIVAEAPGPAVSLFIPMALTAGVLLCVRLARVAVEGAGQMGITRRFGIRDLLFAIFVVAMFMACASRAWAIVVPSYRGNVRAVEWMSWRTCLAEAAGLSAMVLLCVWTAAVRRRRWLPLALLVASPWAAHFLVRWVHQLSTVGKASGGPPLWRGWWRHFSYENEWWTPSLLYAAVAALVLTYLVVWRALFGPSRRAASTNGQHDRPAPRRALDMLRRAGLATALLLLSLVVAGPAGYMYYELVRPVQVPVLAVPEPNGHDRLVSVGRSLVNTEFLDVPSPTAAELEKFVHQNEQAVSLARDALRLASAVPAGELDSPWRRLESLWNLAKLLDARAKLHLQRGQRAEVATAFVDVLRLSAAILRGGIVADASTSQSTLHLAFDGLTQIAPSLDATACQTLMQELSGFEQNLEPLEAFQARDDAVSRLSSGWLSRWGHTLRTLAGIYPAARQWEWRDAMLAEIRVLHSDLAIQACRQERGRLPQKVADLIPQYLQNTLIDPFDGQPLRIRLEERGYTVYSVGYNRRDDGGFSNRDRGDWPLIQRTVDIVCP